jgi:hypothetical protein
MPSFQVPVLGFAVRFLSPFPDSLPQLFLRCLPHALAFGLSPSNPLSFVRFSSGSGYSASVSSFPLFPASPHSGFSGAAPSAFASLAFPVLSGLVSRAFFPGSSYSALCNSFLRPPSRLTVATLAPQPSPFRFPASSPWLSL